MIFIYRENEELSSIETKTCLWVHQYWFVFVCECLIYPLQHPKYHISKFLNDEFEVHHPKTCYEYPWLKGFQLASNMEIYIYTLSVAISKKCFGIRLCLEIMFKTGFIHFPTNCDAQWSESIMDIEHKCHMCMANILEWQIS